MLTIDNHSRDQAGLTYIYPVVSRRAEGLSIGINLNTNNTCNWQCIYCQVPNLTLGKPATIDIDLVTSELRNFLTDVLKGDFYSRYELEASMRQIKDIALSGNGEPTLAKEFGQVVDIVGKLMEEFSLIGKINLVLITNGSQTFKANVKAGLQRINQLGGEVWFKIDSATPSGIYRINQVQISIKQTLEHLEACVECVPVWLQSCFFMLDGKPTPPEEIDSYINMLQMLHAGKIKLRGILLYGIARPSMQADADRLGRVSVEWLDSLAGRIRRIYPVVKVFP